MSLSPSLLSALGYKYTSTLFEKLIPAFRSGFTYFYCGTPLRVLQVLDSLLSLSFADRGFCYENRALLRPNNSRIESRLGTSSCDLSLISGTAGSPPSFRIG